MAAEQDVTGSVSAVGLEVSAVKICVTGTACYGEGDYYPMAAEQDVTVWVRAVGSERLFCLQ
jgi:hypothetical protein